jgi:hypothetical protein
MKRMLLAVVLVAALVLSMGIIPAMAEDVPTTVTVQGGTTTPPIVKCKWEQDTSVNLEQGDPGHTVPGSQFLPPLVYDGTIVVEYWVVVTDPEGVGTISQVTVDVYHPAGPPENGSFKYQVILDKVDKATVGMPAYIAARDAGLITYNAGYDDAEVWNELDKCTADVYMGTALLSYHQPCGAYLVVADACDNGNAWASENETHLENTFDYLCTAGMEIDFDSLDYGTVEVCTNKWVAGDTIFDDPVGPAPVPNPATVRNIGNCDIQITVVQDDMGFGFSGDPATPDWNVEYDARMGSDPINEVVYVPYQDVTLPNKLPLCNTEELDFSIHVKKSMAVPHSGVMTLGCVVAPF